MNIFLRKDKDYETIYTYIFLNSFEFFNQYALIYGLRVTSFFRGWKLSKTLPINFSPINKKKCF